MNDFDNYEQNEQGLPSTSTNPSNLIPELPNAETEYQIVPQPGSYPEVIWLSSFILSIK